MFQGRAQEREDREHIAVANDVRKCPDLLARDERPQVSEDHNLIRNVRRAPVSSGEPHDVRRGRIDRQTVPLEQATAHRVRRLEEVGEHLDAAVS